MKRTIFMLFIFTLLIISGCSQNQLPNEIKKEIELPCKAVSEAHLTINFDKSDPEKEKVSLESAYVFCGNRKPRKPNIMPFYELKILDDNNVVIDSTPLLVTYFELVEYYNVSVGSVNEINSTFVTPELEYTQNWETLQIFKNNFLLFETSISDLLCNDNNVCDANENFFSCPQVCKSGGSDKYCDRQDDGICDPDCDKTADIDC